jgi:YD repeat-containing protein
MTNSDASYDSDGNLTNDGRWTYTWDAENRLSTVVARTVPGPNSR